MKYTKKQFFEDVAKEATALKEHATKEELNKLDFKQLDPENKHLCIYGQMTEDCTSMRASELVFNCCKRFFVKNFRFDPREGFNNAKECVNGEKVNGINTPADLKRDRYEMRHFSSIETYILLPQAKNKNLISFLKGEREDLVL